MDTHWDIEFYSNDEGSCEIQDWILGLKQSHQAKIIAWVDKLQEMGPLLPRPYADILRDGIHELRITVGHNQVRILYFFVFKSTIVMTHPFYKNVLRVPEKEIKKALHIRDEYMKRSEK